MTFKTKHIEHLKCKFIQKCNIHQIKNELKDTKGVITICKSKKNRQHNGQKDKARRTNKDLQNITHKTKDRVTRTQLNPGVNSGAPEG